MEVFSNWLKDNRYTATAFGELLAKHMGMDAPFSYQTIRHWCSGQHKPRVDVAIAIQELTKGHVSVEAWR